METVIISHFENLNLSPEMMRGLTAMNFSEPTPVQEATIIPFLEKRDLMVQAPTGTGKTGAFGIPVIEKIDVNNRAIQTIILCPTRELAMQTTAVLKTLTKFKSGIRILAIYGGEHIQRQITSLRRRPQIVVATPGRMLDHINRRTTRLDNVSCVVLDEADRMLEMGFREDIDTILQSVPQKRQTVLFSATLPDGIKRIAEQYQTDVQNILVGQDTLTMAPVEQYYSEIRGHAKTSALVELLTQKKFPLSLVFVATKAMADNLSQSLTVAGFRADALHGNLRQSQRDKVMEKYRSGQVSVLVATDVAARGIDVHNIDAVINYDIPGDAESYVHRIGRTGRANQSGTAYTFIYAKERAKLRGIISDTNAAIIPFPLQTATNASLPTLSPVKQKPSSGKKPGKRNSYGKKPYNRYERSMRFGA